MSREDTDDAIRLLCGAVQEIHGIALGARHKCFFELREHEPLLVEALRYLALGDIRNTRVMLDRYEAFIANPPQRDNHDVPF
ncbi:hypothetical protein [Hyphomonas atlantica corrig.]|uniref:hypothetical protein n=1 Tax=Hyphomonas atlantica TaxID=1280948 RepID=UPI002353A49D|nr:hypothetical protein [Hyphomonas atlantica]